jgi:flagellar motor switch protein FliM
MTDMMTTDSRRARPDDNNWQHYDFRRPNKLTRDQVRSLDLLHDNFCRRLAAGLGAAVRGNATAEIVHTTQLSWEDYLRTLPATTVLATMSLAPLPGEVLVELDTSIALALVDRLLGGRGGMYAPRRPTDLETPPLRWIADVSVAAFREAISQFIEVDARLEGLDFTPQLLALSAPSGMVLVLTYALSIPAAGISGDLSVCIPLITLGPALNELAAHAAERTANDAESREMTGIIHRIPVTVEARLNATDLPAGLIARLEVGNVLVLDHRITEPAIAVVAGVPILTGHIGRRGRRFALSVSEHPFADPDGPFGANGHHGYERVHEGPFEE